MKTYKIEIEEILQEVYEIEAESLEDAISIAEEKYYSGEYELSPETVKERNFREYKDELEKEKTKNKDRER